jgi:GntR family transcriptional regulator/MocR family aminotransferase
VIDRLSAIRIASDLQGDLGIQCAVAALFETGEFGRHVRRMRRTYRSRRDALAEALAAELGDVLRFAVPSGGMALWARIVDGTDIDEWAHSASALGVMFRGARPYVFNDEPLPCARLGFSFHNETELQDAVHRMAIALRHVRKGGRP